jgi:hypothetical protein
MVSLQSIFFCDTLKGVDNSPPTTNAADRRSNRRPLRLALVLLMDTEQGEIRKEGATIDVSNHGCRVEGVEPLCEGQLVRLLPWETPDGAIAGRVVWVGEPASNTAGEAGIEFLHPLPSLI